MKEPIPRHEKVRFRRRDVTGWHSYPSAEAEALAARPALIPAWISRPVMWAGAAIGGLVLLIVCALLVLPSAGVESAWLRDQAERAVTQFAGDEFEAHIGRTTLALDRRYFLAIGVEDFTMSERGAETTFAEAGRLGFGVRFWPLIKGQVEIGSATLTGARIMVPGGAAAADGSGALMGPDGLIDPDSLIDAVFAGLAQLRERTGTAGIETIRLRDVELVVPVGRGEPRTVLIEVADLTGTSEDGIDLSAEIAALDQRISITGSAVTTEGGSDGFDLEAVIAANGKTYEMGGERPEDSGSVRLGDITVTAVGSTADAEGPDSISLRISVGESDVVVGGSEMFQANARVDTSLTHGAGALSIDRLDLVVERSTLSFSGLISPNAVDHADDRPAYDFRIIGSPLTIAPLESPEPALTAIARIAGWISPDGQRIVANDINVTTGQGEVIGTGAMEIVPGKSPGISLALAVSRLSVGHAKNIWPFFAAPAARTWALNNVFGGLVENSRLLYRIAPGRLGDGIPLSSEEVSGHFEVKGTRFDVAGSIPPMRDTNGSIDFAGTDVDIALDSGTIFTEGGRMLDARNGTLLIRDAHIPPLIGDVDVEIDGSAAAVTEVAGYDPINLSRYLPISPDGISGTASGRVLASIPLDDSISSDDLDWHLQLDYEGLSLAEPYEGQRIEDAKGTIVADPEQADFVAEAKLNGIRGELTLSEPLGEDKSNRKRQARLFLEEGDADKLFDGLSEMVSGPITLDVEQIGPGREKVEADLSRATLTLPWIGWTKGRGVRATTSFVMNRDGATTELADFRLDGDGFGGSGSIKVDDKGLASARFARIAFAPDDNISMGLDRKGSNYAINVSGQSLDARFLIKEFASVMPGASSGGPTENSGGSSTSVSVNAEISRVKGFNNTTLVGAKLAYADAASDVPGMRLSATTMEGARATIVDASAGGSRKVEIKADDAGALLRFIDVYDKLGGGRAALSLSGRTGAPLTGRIDMREFSLIDEDRLESMVNRAGPGGERSLNDALNRKVDVSRAQFDRGSAAIVLGENYLTVSDGVVSGGSIGSTFSGTVFDADGNMAISGTFLPAYGINRIFSEIPLLGQLLGNGRGGGLIGITYRLSGPANEPTLEVNPLSLVAPGIFRSIFEFR